MPQFLLPNYGWPHQKAGKEYPKDEKSFRTTLKADSFQRGFYLCDCRRKTNKKKEIFPLL